MTAWMFLTPLYHAVTAWFYICFYSRKVKNFQDKYWKPVDTIVGRPRIPGSYKESQTTKQQLLV